MFKSFIKTLGTKDAIEELIQTFILDSEFVYRNEFGEGTSDEHGRKMMSPQNMSFALSYALTDNGPDVQLEKAVKEGRLNSREDIEREVRRMLAKRGIWYAIEKSVKGVDDMTNTPIRKLRFFREFFSYPNFR